MRGKPEQAANACRPKGCGGAGPPALLRLLGDVPHRLCRRVAQAVPRRISDRQVLRVIKMWLKTPLEERDENGNKRMTVGKRSQRGTPRGGVISPLPANLYLNRFLKHWRRQGKGREFRAVVVNCADDFVILSRGGAAEALEWTEQVMTRIGPTLNRTKTKLVQAEQERFDFLGYMFGPHRCKKDGHGYLGASPSAKSVARPRRKVREALRPSEVGCWEEVSGRLTECWWAGCWWAGRMTSRAGPGCWRIGRWSST